MIDFRLLFDVWRYAVLKVLPVAIASVLLISCGGGVDSVVVVDVADAVAPTK